ncbi:MAG: FAD-dependent monooxygenase, partial [Candidatus Marsarchaeota archaeon]|nr:FAD-dependent monooxygenase [Candidatus Marsarchaeota archaeon]
VGAVIHSKHFSFRVERRTPVAVVLDRQKLDEEVIKEGVESGAELKLKTRLEGIKKNKAETSRGRLDFDYLIGADGVSSTTASILKLPEIKRKVLCYEAEFKGKNEEKLVDVYLDSEQFPGFYGWIVPAGAETKTGFGTTEIKKIKEIRKKFLQRSEIRKFKKLNRDFHAFIPMKREALYKKNNVLLVGDAAGQVKSTTGGGIVFGGLGAMTAVKKLDYYEKEWRKQKTLKRHLLIRSIADKLGNNLLDSAVFSAGFGFNKILEAFGDMDFIFKQ